MRPKTISASSLTNARDCMKKYAAMNLDLVPETGQKFPAKVGTAFHHAAQWFVQGCCIDKSHGWEWSIFEDLLEEGYLVTFGTADTQTGWHEDLMALGRKWFDRTDLSKVKVMSVEQKRRIPVPSADYDKDVPAEDQPGAAVVPFSYIWDRCDVYVDEVTGERVVRIVDYKTIRKLPKLDELSTLLQLRYYAMAAMIFFRHEKPDRIVCQLDLIRGDGVMGVTFTVAECMKTWENLRKELQRILDTPQTEAVATLGPGCRYCAIAPTCEERGRNIDGGGMQSLELSDQLALRIRIQAQQDSNKVLMDELNDAIIAEAIELDEIYFEVGRYQVELKMSSIRKPDQQRYQTVLGPERYMELAPITMAKHDELIKGDLLTDEQKVLLEQCYTKVPKNPTIEVAAPAAVVEGE